MPTYPRVFRYLLWCLRDRDAAEELAAEVFAIALTAFQKGTEPRHVRSWLVGIADHLAARSWSKQQTEGAITDSRLATEQDPEELVLGRLESAMVWRCMDALSPEHRQILLLRIVAGLSARVTEHEWTVMRRHPAVGEQILLPVERMRGVAKIVRHHQEKWDRTGYPDGLRGEAIPLGARILAVVDAYSAIIDARPYKTPKTPRKPNPRSGAVPGHTLIPGLSRCFVRRCSALQGAAQRSGLRSPGSPAANCH